VSGPRYQREHAISFWKSGHCHLSEFRQRKKEPNLFSFQILRSMPIKEIDAKA
jgi:hypothetical protein